MKCVICDNKMIKEDLRMSSFVGTYKYAYVCPNGCNSFKNKGDEEMGIRKHFKESEIEEMTMDVLFESMNPMTGAQIAKELGITRQAISNTLKRAMDKVFAETKKLEKGMNNFEVAVMMSQIFGVDQDSEEELKKFFKLFNPATRKKIEQDGAKYLSKFQRK